MGFCAIVVALVCSNLFIIAGAQRFDFFYFVLQWPGAYCDRGQAACCYPTTGKPAEDFSIHGLWPNKDDGTWPQFCDPSNPFELSQISDLRRAMNREWGSLDCPSSNSVEFWEHEWEKHGTCAFRDEHQYFERSLALREQVDPLGYLASAGIRPNNRLYSLQSIQLALEDGLGHTIGIECNRDSSRTAQLYQLYFCVASDASTIIDCPVFPNSKCTTQVEFPSFGRGIKRDHDHEIATL
ncbi:hypothetical protein SELMODRAFT_270532 [Selaginella moellendorffii]|uniref:Uncharacterized protein n=1 Tax=Selaginella moellendorffii TaxID=88036 RepID=D8R484_SELML|nr:ribonuclease 1 [Selaginella moellendorffii]XP_002989227.1 ribonuclease 1 [Selaginella moellendorffii]EFJ09665.1 hypothetical protein SELMODRAFT_184437 [Selaginella moellendorffii]EFJ33419.1 hypothetical protein SELMODRAFT_270532 [Selaginella moellendorffii]|eukprot:XP_002965999.1 ribonuclease 1 [Selaginella moellendorffii]